LRELGARWCPSRHTSDVIWHCAGTTVGQTLLIDGSGMDLPTHLDGKERKKNTKTDPDTSSPIISKMCSQFITKFAIFIFRAKRKVTSLATLSGGMFAVVDRWPETMCNAQ